MNRSRSPPRRKSRWGAAAQDPEPPAPIHMTGTLAAPAAAHDVVASHVDAVASTKSLDAAMKLENCSPSHVAGSSQQKQESSSSDESGENGHKKKSHKHRKKHHKSKKKHRKHKKKHSRHSSERRHEHSLADTGTVLDSSDAAGRSADADDAIAERERRERARKYAAELL